MMIAACVIMFHISTIGKSAPIFRHLSMLLDGPLTQIDVESDPTLSEMGGFSACVTPHDLLGLPVAGWWPHPISARHGSIHQVAWTALFLSGVTARVQTSPRSTLYCNP
jgi:hypothetical protein